MKLPQVRTCYTLGFLICLGLFLVAAYAQFFLGFEPCPLCQLQRYALVLVAFGFLLVAIQNPGHAGIWRYTLVIVCFAIVGALFAGRQVWLQTLFLSTGEMPMCGVGFDYLLKTVPLLDALKITMMGTADCADQGLLFFGLSMASWSLLAFIILGLWALLQAFRTKRVC